MRDHEHFLYLPGWLYTCSAVINMIFYQENKAAVSETLSKMSSKVSTIIPTLAKCMWTSWHSTNMWKLNMFQSFNQMLKLLQGFATHQPQKHQWGPTLMLVSRPGSSLVLRKGAGWGSRWNRKGTNTVGRTLLSKILLYAVELRGPNNERSLRPQV